MLSPEVAQDQLKQFKVDGTNNRNARIQKLPGSLKSIALSIQEYSKRFYATDNKDVAGPLQQLSDTDRITLFNAFCPKIGKYLNDAWNLYPKLPYQSNMGGFRRSFRAPNNPELSNESRIHWLNSIIFLTSEYEEDIEWYAVWSPYLMNYYGDQFGILFAAAIESLDETGNRVYDILLSCAKGEHEIGMMGRHVTRALLISSRHEAWDYLEKMLIAAQRQEGLRQNILETIDEAHPEVFLRMLKIIRDEKLTRFSSVIRAIDVWFGFQYDVTNEREAMEIVELVIGFLENTHVRDNAIRFSNGNDAYFALCSAAFHDAMEAITLAQPLIEDISPERRFAAAYFLIQLQIDGAMRLLTNMLEDTDLRITALVLHQFNTMSYKDSSKEYDDVYDRLERILNKLPEKNTTLDPIVWPWIKLQISRSKALAGMIQYFGKRPIDLLVPYVEMMDSDVRRNYLYLIKERDEITPKVRETLLILAGDLSSGNREAAYALLAKSKPSKDESIVLGNYLTRKSSDLRQGIVTLLLNQDDESACDSGTRLLESKDINQRCAGLEIMQTLVKNNRIAQQCRDVVITWKSKQSTLTQQETNLLDFIEEQPDVEYTPENAFGLADLSKMTPPIAPQKEKKILFFKGNTVDFTSKAAMALIKSLDKLIHSNRERTITWNAGGNEHTEILGNSYWQIGNPWENTYTQPIIENLPLKDLWEDWFNGRPTQERDQDGFELYRAYYLLNYKQDKDKLDLKYAHITQAILGWMLCLHNPVGSIDFLLSAVNQAYSSVNEEEKQPPKDPNNNFGFDPSNFAMLTQMSNYLSYGMQFHVDWRLKPERSTWLMMARRHRALFHQDWSIEQFSQYYGLLRWMDQPGFETPRMRPTLEETITAYRKGIAVKEDIYDQLVGPIDDNRYGRYNSALAMLSGRKIPAQYENDDFLKEIVNECRERLIDIESKRGEMPTKASPYVQSIKYAGGIDNLLKLVSSMGKDSYTRGYHYGSLTNRADIFSQLIRSTFPKTDETPQACIDKIKSTAVPEKKLIETAMYAPQWARHIEAYLGISYFAEAVWWMHAHTKDQQWSVDQSIREEWTAEISKATPLTSEELIEGAVDVKWFEQIHNHISPKLWKQLDDAAKFASSGSGHKRAQLFADAMLGKLPENEVIERIEQKRHQDSIRALGLLPLPVDQTDRRAATLRRYKTLQEFRRGANQFGAQRQASEKLAVDIGMQNLARTSGYQDPIRLEWTMELEAVRDLMDGPVTVTDGDISVSLSIDEWGDPDITVSKNGKPLKAVPPAAKKKPEIAELCSRKTEISRQASRMRISLENSMIRGDLFYAAEIIDLIQHPVLKPMLRSIILKTDSLIGYPVNGGRSLEKHDGSIDDIPSDALLTIAHPYDLLQTGEWHHWQHECFVHERIQPFKQVFRELYVLTKAELKDEFYSQRYSGHQLNKNQAAGILNKRGWICDPYEYDFTRTYHEAGITISIDADMGVTTPAEVEGLTIGCIHATKKNQWGAIKLEDIPPRIFSEAMRDIDLVVSVAHQGGVDPEASASTVEMRAALVQEASTLLKLDNVKIKDNYVLVDGKLANYTIHLGSAVVHRMPGGHLCIVPVQSQHRGCIFLPFMDSDPRTAEVVSKTILLAKDNEIKDPVILEQLYSH